MDKLIELSSYPVSRTLHLLLKDKTTGKNIVWATNSYTEYGSAYAADCQMTEDLVAGLNSNVIQPRIFKAAAAKSERTKKSGEVFTPAWICNKMITDIDAVWFNRPSEHYRYMFNKPNGTTWKARKKPVWFAKTRSWKKYVDSRRLEITCGEAPYLVSRYDAASGEIIPIKQRIGILDRKLRVVNENAADEAEWLEWAIRAFQSVYGYEYQGDNLLIARINLIMTFSDYIQERWQREPTEKELKKIANIIAWNIWQMDGHKGRVPYVPQVFSEQMTIMSLVDGEDEQSEQEKPPLCRIYDWRRDNSLDFVDLNEDLVGLRKVGISMRFDFAIGNPPYQDETVGEQKQFAPPVYNLFLEEAYKIAGKVEMIHPARFLFNAGGTSKEWNEKMLSDEHLKVLYHEQDSSKVFANTDIKGGVAITYRDSSKKFGAIGVYSPFPELNSIRVKVQSTNPNNLSDIVANRGLYRFSDRAYSECPDELAKTSDSRIGASSFERMSSLFYENKPNDDFEYVQIYGLLGRERVYRWFRKDYVKLVDSFYKFKTIVTAVNGSGALGEPLSTPLIGQPLIGHTETFLSIGSFDTQFEADACLKYVKTKFARAMLAILKITQHNSPEKWRYVPLQDFTPNSDIDWSKSIPEIDKQLYAKYGLSPEEIEFIETKVKEMV